MKRRSIGAGALVRRRLAAALIARRCRVEALLCAGADPVIASRLGLHRLAERGFRAAPPRSAEEFRASVASALACGDREVALRRAAAAPEEARDAVALELAPVAAGEALRLARDDVRLRAALALRDDQAQTAEALLADLAGAEAELLRIDAAVRRSDLGAAAAGWRRVFESAGLAPPEPVDWAVPLGPTNVQAQAAPVASGPLVSVIMPVCDVESYVGAAVRSILNQTWRNLELIVVDDASVDQTPALVRAAGAGDARLSLLSTGRRSGPYRARNLALARARGELVCFADGDDWSHPERIARQAAFMARTGLLAASAKHVRVDEAGRPYARQLTPLIRWCPSSLMFRRVPVLSRAGHFDEVRTGADAEYWARLIAAFGARRVRIARDLLVVAAQRPTSLTGSAETGYAAGWSGARLRYWEAWNFWHARCRAAGRSPVWRAGEGRPFPLSAKFSAEA